MEPFIHSSERRADFRDWQMLGSEGSSVQGVVVFLFNLNKINISKCGKIRLIFYFFFW